MRANNHIVVRKQTFVREFFKICNRISIRGEKYMFAGAGWWLLVSRILTENEFCTWIRRWNFNLNFFSLCVAFIYQALLWHVEEHRLKIEKINGVLLCIKHFKMNIEIQ